MEFLALLFLISSTFLSQAFSCPSGTVQSSLDSSICYSFIAENTTGYGASELCMQTRNHAYMTYGASIWSSYENAFVYSYLKNLTTYPVWLGGSAYVDAKGLFHWGWDDGSKFNYSNWIPGESRGKKFDIF